MGGLRRGQGVDDVEGSREQYRVASQTSLVSPGGGQMGFAQSGPAPENDVGLVLEEAKAEEILRLGTIDLLGPGPVELCEGFEDREPCRLDGTLRGPIFSPARFAFDPAA